MTHYTCAPACMHADDLLGSAIHVCDAFPLPSVCVARPSSAKCAWLAFMVWQQTPYSPYPQPLNSGWPQTSSHVKAAVRGRTKGSSLAWGPGSSA
eukprot:365367-Chlamydomonas_euryale.AAC.4